MTTQLTYDFLEKFVSTHGLPLSVGTTGWSQQDCFYTIANADVGTSHDALKGWIYLRSDGLSDDGDIDDDGPAYKNYEQLWNVIVAIIVGDTSDMDLLIDDDTGERIARLFDRDMVGKSWEFEAADGIDIYAMIRASLEGDGVDPDSIPEDDELDVYDFLIDKADANWGDTEYSLSYAYAYLEFKDGTTVLIERKEDSGEIYVSRVNNEDVDPMKPFS